MPQETGPYWQTSSSVFFANNDTLVDLYDIRLAEHLGLAQAIDVTAVEAVPRERYLNGYEDLIVRSGLFARILKRCHWATVKGHNAAGWGLVGLFVGRAEGRYRRHRKWRQPMLYVMVMYRACALFDNFASRLISKRQYHRILRESRHQRQVHSKSVSHTS